MVKVFRSAFQKNSSSHSLEKLCQPAHSIWVGSVSSTWCSEAHPV
ncbi:hypothetical protein SANTM175S_10902 [Streptomyces antimycoticus]